MSLSPCRLLAVLILFAGIGFVPGNARAETHATCTGFIDSLPATITTQGVWCLRGDLATAITSGNAISIATNNVTIDCNGFKIGGLAAGDGSVATGIRASSRQNAVVRHCNVRGFQYGAYLTGAGHLVEDSRFDNNLYIGIYISGDNNVVRRNRVHDTGGPSSSATAYPYGIFASAHVVDNIVAGVFSTASNTSPRGIDFGGLGSVASGNQVSGLQATGNGSAIGIRALSSGTRIEGNQVVVPSGTDGRGIDGYTANMTVCSNNTTSGFSIPMIDCLDNWGNASL